MQNSKDFFQFSGFVVYQGEAGLKVNTDGVLLGAYAQQSNPINILDIGCGTGVIGAILAYKFPKSRHKWVDINPQAQKAARLTANAHPIKNNIEVIAGDILELEFPCKFDLIVCNPPYFKSHSAKSEERKVARQQDCLNYQQLLETIAKNISVSGKSYLILPKESREEINYLAIKNGLWINEVLSVKDTPKSDSQRIILTLSNQVKPTENRTVVLYHSNGTPHPDFIHLCGGYYLNIPNRKIN